MLCFRTARYLLAGQQVSRYSPLLSHSHSLTHSLLSRFPSLTSSSPLTFSSLLSLSPHFLTHSLSHSLTLLSLFMSFSRFFTERQRRHFTFVPNCPIIQWRECRYDESSVWQDNSWKSHRDISRYSNNNNSSDNNNTNNHSSNINNIWILYNVVRFGFFQSSWKTLNQLLDLDSQSRDRPADSPGPRRNWSFTVWSSKDE